MPYSSYIKYINTFLTKGMIADSIRLRCNNLHRPLYTSAYAP